MLRILGLKCVSYVTLIQPPPTPHNATPYLLTPLNALRNICMALTDQYNFRNMYPLL